ncbi:hypothetical protein GUJ93_ZPchr0010g8027 [Zizania palustris]|uniref:Pectin acetylesterase n=1 Tax=Zizania palustris TaxID=103762 RepID=A0A8J5WHT3_ZIZPA|nr:hypothetical protein GUJ93_ZPchr0010g8027 [Zizania palustris]
MAQDLGARVPQRCFFTSYSSTPPTRHAGAIHSPRSCSLTTASHRSSKTHPSLAHYPRHPASRYPWCNDKQLNSVVLRYCDGTSFAGDAEAQDKGEYMIVFF